MFARLKGMLGFLGGSDLTQSQREAILDLLLWTMYVDRRIAVPENEQIDQLPEEFSWRSVTPFSLYVNTSLARVREVLSDPEAAETLLADVQRRLDTEATRRKAYEACNRLACADGQVAEEEARFLERIQARFGLSV